ncbi:MAG TPA: hypothetical protein DC054_09205 [Blastocatellia bacterium]|nr:hypothetical protein [Blastocatellia bacterium]
MQKSQSEGEAFQKGYLVGKAEVYCEQVRTGAKLAGAFGFDRRYVGLVRRTVRTEGCKVVIDQAYSPDRATAYVYKYAFVKKLMKTFFSRSGKPVAGSAIWVSGKLFGYSDFEIARYLEERGYVSNPFK